MKNFQELLGELNSLRLKKMAQLRLIASLTILKWDKKNYQKELEQTKYKIEQVQQEIKEMAAQELRVIELLKETQVTIK